jgi:purine-binding chemotaxis protein CheW
MNEVPQENSINQLFPSEKKDFADIDFSSLLDLSNLESSVFSAEKYKAAEGEKYIVFHLDEKLYGIRSNRVSEVASSIPVTPLPNVPEWLLGIANLRGDIISVVDLRKLFRKNTQSPPKTRLIVFRSNKNDTSIAFVVDKLNEIVTLSSKEINFSAADFEDSFPTISGKADFKSNTLFLLDIDNILSTLSLGNVPT